MEIIDEHIIFALKEISDVCDQFIFGIKTQIQHNIFI